MNKHSVNHLISNVRKPFSRIVTNRKGTAEIVGGVLLILILIFFFTNVYLWNNKATSQMNTLNSQKMNSPVSIGATSDGASFNVTINNNGIVDVCLSRLWINESLGGVQTHVYVELQNETANPSGIWIQPGSNVNLTLTPVGTLSSPYSPLLPIGQTTIQYPSPDDNSIVTVRILTTMGNGASCTL